jgi:DNA-binding transcriptional LysR family regulator
MELRQIRYFVAVADERNFARAAERLRIAQSGLSQQIMVLERSLGARLIDRSIRPVELTAEGEVFLEQARRILDLVDNATERVRAVSEHRSTSLKVGASVFGNAPRVDELLRMARAGLADVDVQVSLDIAPHNISSLNRRELDAVVTYVPFDSGEHPRYMCLGSTEIVLAVPAGHPLASAHRIPRDALAAEPFLVAPRKVNSPVANSIYRSLFGQLDPPNMVQLIDYPARFQMVVDGVGLAPVMVPTEDLLPVPGLVYRRIEEPAPTFEYGLVWFEDHASPALDAFLGLARDVCVRVAEVPVDQLIARSEAA